jgi:enamine deaminase RidA (YjgF/YER057c/UK114 family)
VPDTSPLRPVLVEGGLAYVSGQPPARDGKIQYLGNVGEAVSVDDGYLAAQLCALNILGALERELGSLDRIDRIVKVVGFVSCAAGFTEQSKVINGASDLFVQLFGERGRHARSAIGVAALPAGMAVEVEAVVGLRPAG